MRKRVCALLATVAVVLLLPAAPALAEPRGQLDQIRVAGRTLQMVLTADGLAPGVVIDTASVQVRVDGRPVATQARQATAAVPRTAVLAIDTSGSMTGEPLQAARRAALAFLASVDADVRVGLVTFATAPVLRVRPTLDRAAVRAELDGLDAAGRTTLNDAAAFAAAAAGTTGVRRVVLLTDGRDEGSRTAPGAAVAAVRRSGVRVDAVALGDKAAVAALRSFTGASRGRLVQASSVADLSRAFEDASRSISSQLAVVATLPPGTSRAVDLEVTARAGGQAFTVEAPFTLTAAPRATGSSPAASAFGPRPIPAAGVPGWALPVGLAVLFLGLAAGLALAFTSRVALSAPGGWIAERLQGYAITGPPAAAAPPATTALGTSPMARSAVEIARRVVARRGLDEALSRRLNAAGLPLKPAEWVLVHAGLALGAGLLFFLLSAGGVAAGLIGLLVGAAAPQAYLANRARRRVDAFLQALPDTLQLMAGSLQVGYSLAQAVETVVQEGQPPVSTEFNRALVESRLGVPIEDALDRIAARLGSKDLGWAVTAMRIQREVGGNLPEILVTVASTLRERERIRRQVRVLSAEGRLSAVILGLLPPLFLTYVLLVRRNYLRPLLTDPLGWVLLAAAAVLMGAAVVWLRRVVRVEV